MLYTHEKNLPTSLSPQWLCGNSCTWSHEVWLHIAGTNEPNITTFIHTIISAKYTTNIVDHLIIG